MHNSQNKKTLQIVLLVVIAVVTLGIGYAAISSVNLIINGNATASVDQNNFIVHFIEAKNITGTTGASGTSSIDTQDDTKAMFDVTGLTKVGDYAEAVYTVRNDSNGIGAEITLNLTNSNTEYFKVTETILDDKLQAGEETTAKVKVEMIKTPITDAVSTSITATLTASPLEDAEATGGEEKSKVKPGTFAGDSWEMIAENVRNGNTDDYHIGDTKIVQIDINDDGVDEDYIVRVANKSTPTECNDENFSQTACGFVVEFVDIIIGMQMRDTDTNVGGYPATLVYDYLKNTLYGQLPSDLQAAIKPTRVISGHGTKDADNFTTTDNLYLLSGVEVSGSDNYDTAAGRTHQLEYYNNSSNSKIKQYNTQNSYWWLRSAYPYDSKNFRNVASYGGLYSHNSRVTNGVAPAFRIG